MGVLIIVPPYGIMAKIKWHNVYKHLAHCLAHTTCSIYRSYQIIRQSSHIASSQNSKRLLSQAYLIFATKLTRNPTDRIETRPSKWDGADLTYIHLCWLKLGGKYTYNEKGVCLVELIYLGAANWRDSRHTLATCIYYLWGAELKYSWATRILTFICFPDALWALRKTCLMIFLPKRNDLLIELQVSVGLLCV